MASSQRFSTNLTLPATPTTNEGELFTELLKVYNAIKIVMGAVDTYCGTEPELPENWAQVGFGRMFAGLNSVFYTTAAANITYGQLVSINGANQAILAQSGVNTAVGFCAAPNGVLVGERCPIQVFGLYPTLPAASLTPGTPYYLSVTPGAIGAAVTAQRVGFAISDRQLWFSP